MFNYLNLRKACDATFGIFLVTWFLARHVAYFAVCWSIQVGLEVIMPYGCYSVSTGEQLTTSVPPESSPALPNIFQPFYWPLKTDAAGRVLKGGLVSRETQGSSTTMMPGPDVVCYTPPIRYAFLALLIALQMLTIIWFGMVLRVAWRVLGGKAAEDSRSDDEGEVEYEEVEIDDEMGEESEMLDADEDGTCLDEKSAGMSGAFSAKGVSYLATNSSPPSPSHSSPSSASPSPAPSSSKEEDVRPVEVEVGGEDIGLGKKGKRARAAAAARRKRQTARASGISIPGHGDRKELLGRIGCDKPS